MSKESKPGDLWRQLDAAAADRPDTWCKGCGYHPFGSAMSSHSRLERCGAGLAGPQLRENIRAPALLICDAVTCGDGLG
jgi:hypothetical protein